MTTAIESKAKSDGIVEVAWTPRTEVPSGIAVAALISVVIGVLTLAIVNVFTAASPAFNAWVHSIGKLWMPGAQGIGPYSGKETLSAVAWLGSWLLLHYAWRHRKLDLSRWLIAFLVGVAVATTLIWPPVFEYIAHLGKA
jgi:hypothetical protein